jgi:hypothetical protein
MHTDRACDVKQIEIYTAKQLVPDLVLLGLRGYFRRASTTNVELEEKRAQER